MEQVRIGIIGVGNIARGVHIPEIQQSKSGVITAICDIDENALREVGEALHIEEAYRFTDYRDLIHCDRVDAVEVCTPNYLHVPMAVACAHAGKPVNVEKPLAISYEQGLELKKAIDAENVKNMMCFSYRYRPSVRYAKDIIEKGLIGNVLSINVEYLKSTAFIPGRKLEWRFVKEYAGTGVLGDLGVHLIDMTRFLVGDLKKVCAQKRIIVKERPTLDGAGVGPVETDDICHFLAELDGGAAATFVITRCAFGNANTIKYDIFGDKGVISFNLNNPDVLGVCIGEIDTQCDGLHFVNVPPQYKVGQEQTFIDMVQGKACDYLPTVEDGVVCQKILDAVLQSAEEGVWVDL